MLLPKKDTPMEHDHVAKIVRISARILGSISFLIHFIVFFVIIIGLTLKRLESSGLYDVMGGFSAVILAGNAISFKYERTGGYALTISAMMYLFFLGTNPGTRSEIQEFILLITLPVICAGVLYILSWRLHRNHK
ncbi:MAG TPA: hypothetical protein VFJ29_06335 [Candidatus Kapabacteria bacterium]|nr:hypothetical protein [Candidatus Kapabacteria bacterium]